MLGRYVFLRLRRALLPDFERRWKRDVEASTTELRSAIATMQTELAELRAFKSRTVVAEWASRTDALVATVEALDLAGVEAHIRSAVAGATLDTTPTAHLVVDEVLPRDVYELLRTAIPPVELFGDRDPVKRDFEMSALDAAPSLTARMWRLFDQHLVSDIVAPLVFERCRDAVEAHYRAMGGEAFGHEAVRMPHRTFAGRIQLRRPGYELGPHLDPKRVVITGLFYFPRPGDPEDHGTELFDVVPRVAQPGMATFFPESVGARCTVARSVSYRANRLLAFVNSGAAHGARLPSGATLDERYAYQFYVKPDDGRLKELLRTLPTEAQQGWEDILAPRRSRE